jgi:DNA-binding LacI/PurR family transcriptional regulator
VARLQGFREAAGDALVEYGDFSEESGSRAMAALLEREPELDAVFAASDPMAFGAMRVLKAAGRRIPEDVAVIGFDGSPDGRHCDPPLTSVFQPAEEMGREMTRLLLAQLAGDQPTETQVIVDTRLELRGSA